MLANNALFADNAADIAAHHYSETADFQRLRASLDEAITQGVSKVLVIYTGGTIGMKHDKANGYLPVKGYLPDKLRSIERFHDADGFNDFDIEFQRSSAFSNPAQQPRGASASVPSERQPPANTSTLIELAKQRLSDMSRGQQRSPRTTAESATVQAARLKGPSLGPGPSFAAPDSKPADPADNIGEPAPTPPYSAVSTGGQSGSQTPDYFNVNSGQSSQLSGKCLELASTADLSKEPVAPDAADESRREDLNCGPCQGVSVPSRLSEWLITPKSMYGRRVQYCFLEYDPLLDSCNMDMTDWVRIVADIEHYYYAFDAFIILHGTDTMSYTASALSFMLQNLGKSVVVTGSQVPIAEVRNDGIENFLGALTIAGHFVIPEVALYFNNKLFRGNRCVKIDATDFEAFSSPNLAPLVKVGVDIEVNWPEVLRPNAIEPFCAHKKMDANVATLRLFPGISASAVRAFLAPPIRGIVLETFGAGNAPDARPAILEALAEASKRGVAIVNVTQCQRGNVSDLYATARGLTKAMVVPGRDMTSECALTKLSYLLGRGFTPEKCRDLLGRSLRGELTIVQSHSRPIFYSGQGRSHTFTQFVSRQILNDTRANESDIEPTPQRSPVGTLARTLSSSDAAAVLTASGDIAAHGVATDGSPKARETVTERAHPEMVSLLLQAGAHFSDAETRDLMLSMQNAISRGDIEFVKLAVRAGFDVSACDHEGRTVLYFAVISSQVEIVQYLLALSRVSVELWDQWGCSPMDYVLRKLDMWSETGAPHEDSINDMQRICALFAEKLSFK
ncbi:hypothetical protein EV174_001299 [Coemansia sp. RSA 2320]|nr:hypothetical protein EV174_001299 [Coemansia sp. RSA 2320]